jgi:transcriptional antiterminator RfaH
MAPAMTPTTQPTAALEPAVAASGPAWFALRSQPKHEHIAAAHLRQDAQVEVLLPRIRFKRLSAIGKRVRVTEALFPGYLFARFDFQTCFRRVQHARGVRGLVHFGERYPVIPPAAIADLRASLGEGDINDVSAEVEPGDEVLVASGPLQGLQAVVERVRSGRERTAILLEFLGRQTLVELDRRLLTVDREGRRISL